MAKAAATSAVGLAAGVIAVTVVAGGLGAAAGLFALASPPKTSARAESVHAPKPGPAPALVKPLPMVLTNLAHPASTLVRLEAALILDPDTPDPDALAAKTAEDFAAYLRTATLSGVEGATGFIYLRADLLDRARIRSHGKARDVAIRALAIE
ncbi:MAG: flagellar basal body-associated FliL family protein [Hyphomicrobiales bacterium]|nr:flagellar basal body-associated FliL family protein [Hyphomicrobiales bacterium]